MFKRNGKLRLEKTWNDPTEIEQRRIIGSSKWKEVKECALKRSFLCEIRIFRSTHFGISDFCALHLRITTGVFDSRTVVFGVQSPAAFPFRSFL
jgi:hypothetical protein